MEYGSLVRRDAQECDGVLARVLRVGEHQRRSPHGPWHRRREEGDQAGIVRLRIAQKREVMDRDHPFGAQQRRQDEVRRVEHRAARRYRDRPRKVPANDAT